MDQFNCTASMVLFYNKKVKLKDTLKTTDGPHFFCILDLVEPGLFYKYNMSINYGLMVFLKNAVHINYFRPIWSKLKCVHPK